MRVAEGMSKKRRSLVRKAELIFSRSSSKSLIAHIHGMSPTRARVREPRTQSDASDGARYPQVVRERTPIVCWNCKHLDGRKAAQMFRGRARSLVPGPEPRRGGGGAVAGPPTATSPDQAASAYELLSRDHDVFPEVIAIDDMMEPWSLTRVPPCGADDRTSFSTTFERLRMNTRHAVAPMAGGEFGQTDSFAECISLLKGTFTQALAPAQAFHGIETFASNSVLGIKVLNTTIN
ncbi:hypothetical protein CMUS01_09715 [Colletotrichum musicola]|uniref:Uncharacterized protein n=1 Tax=Colletotrichum musicola TaxID=2175873 RepID=A0A8H6K6J8_9PEZI|nr:hypothetical protein CMUS01_09715 [Colletotrichum musicola]